MLIKCKSCGAEYELAQFNIPTSGMEFECSECGTKWIQFPLSEKVDPESTNIIDENNITVLYERSILTGEIEDVDSWWNGVNIFVLKKNESN